MREQLIVGSSTLLPPPNNPQPPPLTSNFATAKTIKIFSNHFPDKLPPSSSSSSVTTTTVSTSRPPLLFKNFHQNVPSQKQQQQQRGGGGNLLNYYADLASKLAGEGRLEDFLMIAETVVVSSSNPSQFVVFLNLNLVSSGISTLISDGKLTSVIQVFDRLDKLGITPSALVDKSIQHLLASECQRLVKARKLKDVLVLMETLAGFLIPVEGFVKPSEIFNMCIEENDPNTAVRYVCMLPNASNFFSSIILEFGKKGDLASALIAYEALKSKCDVPNMYMCRAMIDVCGHCGDFLRSRCIYEDLLAQNITPNTYVFNSLMNVNVHDLGYDLHVYKHMKKSGVTPDLASYNILLKACCRAGRADLAQDIYEEVRHIALLGRLKLDVITYSTIIKVFGDAKMWQMALKIKEDMFFDGVIPNVVTWSSLISACANAGLVEQATQVFEEMLLADCQPNSQCCNSLLYACVEARQYDRAFRVFNSWRESGFRRISHVETCKSSGEILIGADNSCKNRISQSCYSSSYNLSCAKVVPFTPTIATYNILMKACGTDFYRAQALMDEIKIAGLSPNHISWSILINICGSTGNVGGSIQGFRYMSENVPLHIDYDLLTFCSHLQTLKHVNDALKAMRENGVKPDVIAYTTTIKACVRNRSLELAFSLFEEMKRFRVKPNLIMGITARDLAATTQAQYSEEEQRRCLQDEACSNYFDNGSTMRCCEDLTTNYSWSSEEEDDLYNFFSTRNDQEIPQKVTYNTLLRARRHYGSLHEVQQCLAIYQDMRKAGYRPNDYFLKEVVEEWCEGVITNNYRDESTVGRSDSHDKTERGTPQSMLLERVAEHLQRDISQSLVVDLRGVTKVEARIVVLAALRMIKEQYNIGGESVEDDIVIILGSKCILEVQSAVVKLLEDELGLEVVVVRMEQEQKEFPRRPAVLTRLKVTRKSLCRWLQTRPKGG